MFELEYNCLKHELSKISKTKAGLCQQVQLLKQLAGLDCLMEKATQLRSGAHFTIFSIVIANL